MTINHASANGKIPSTNGNSKIAATLGATSQFQFLKPIKFQKVSFWDFSSNSVQQDLAKHKFKLVRFSDLIEQRKGYFTIDDEKEYKRCKVQLYSRGVVLRDIVKGKEIQTKKQQICKAEDFLVAEIDAKVGGYGIVPSELEGAIVSSHYYLYEIDKTKLLPDFLRLYLKTDEFAKQVQPSGSTNYASIRAYQVLEYQVPLPPIKKQEQIVADYQNKLSQAEKFKKKAENLEKEIENYLLQELGIEIQQTENERWHNFKFLQSSQLKELNRWSVDFLANQSDLEEIRKSKFDVVDFGELITYAQYGISEKSSARKEGIPMLRMNNIFEGELDLSNLKYVSLAKDKLENLFLQKDDFLFNRTNSKELVGKTAIFNAEGIYTFASYLIRLKLDQKKANIYFINYIFNSPVIRRQIDIISRQVLGQANINLTELKSFLIPLPPLSVQEKVVKKVNSLKTQIKKLKLDEKNLRRQAKADFESELFEI